MFLSLILSIFTEAFNFGDQQGTSTSGIAPYQPFLQQAPNMLGNPQFAQVGSNQYHIPQQQQGALQTPLQVTSFFLSVNYPILFCFPSFYGCYLLVIVILLSHTLPFVILQDVYQLAPVNTTPMQMMLGGSGGASSFDNHPPGSLAPGGPVGGGDSWEAPLPPSSNALLQRPPGQPSGNYVQVC